MNVEALRALAKKLRRLRHEEHYDQSLYAQKTACGTACCLAGHVAAGLGAKFIFKKEFYIVNPFAMFATLGGRRRRVSSIAREELKLGRVAAARLFSEAPGLDWPEPFASRWEKRCLCRRGKDKSRRPSRIAADLLDALADGIVKL